MEKSSYLSMTFNNIVFKGRNQAYGAFALRKAYNKHITRAYLIATAIFSGALVGPLVDSIYFDDPVKYKEPTYVILEPYVLKLPTPPKPEPVKAASPLPAAPEKAVATEKYVPPKVVPNDAAVKEETMANQEEISKASIGTAKVAGELPEMPSVSLSDAPPAGIEGGTGEKEAEPKEYVYVEQMPEFRGGNEALAAFLSSKLRYPNAAQSNGVEGTVVVSFVVGTTGDISQVQVLKGLGYGTEEEAERVIRSMPDWKPGKQNGRAVPVRYTLPIRFSLK
ncbi:energy transducer TonB [Pontibacter actiniarum]|uniref:TonB C-terminal domain-containing protein n=1 Tax=Pontibacter actiniarum TaxID=323450 RepID=A0A1X9YV55_9BACT|nr:energy transducer TonB [Pontibacter actiniarum]ARS36654.1 hypothetical protein CA264_15185 [Pontibacter actiniarum]